MLLALRILYYACECSACMYLCALCVPGACRVQMNALDSLELKIGLVVSHHVGVENPSQASSARAANALNHGNQPSPPPTPAPSPRRQFNIHA